ncbi:hypothetical protein F5Y03DRAFT_409128 [Xylaria venustula]|nr:hypothetical protein F5Y03DRAFT_409128 [Xylaria venustula]
MADAIGFVADILGIWSFGADALSNHIPDASTYKVRAAVNGYQLNGQGLSGADGTISNIKSYNINGNLIGAGDGASIGSGDVAELQAIQNDGDSQQSITTEFYASNDAICIAYITAMMDQETTGYGWTGDWGYTCGLDWYLSGILLANTVGSKQSTRCTWIDGDHTNDIQAGVIAISWPDFVGNKSSPPTGDGTNLCGSSLRAWPNEGGNQILSPTGVIAARQIGPRKSRRSDDRLVVSHLVSHNATELCLSDTSYGPDFVSISEGVYCNMETHEVMPVCDDASGGVTSGCLEINGTESPAASVAADGSKKATGHTHVVEWK